MSFGSGHPLRVLVRLGKSWFAWAIPLFFTIAWTLPAPDPFLLAPAMLAVSFALPLMCLSIPLAFRAVSSPSKRIILVVLWGLHVGLFVYLFANRSMIWQYWI